MHAVWCMLYPLRPKVLAVVRCISPMLFSLWRLNLPNTANADARLDLALAPRGLTRASSPSSIWEPLLVRITIDGDADTDSLSF